MRTETSENDPRPFRRIVFYLGGFDPRGAAFTHLACVDEAAKWSKASGYTVETGTRDGLAQIGDVWPMTADLPSGRVETDFQFLRWDDIVRRNWERSTLRVILRISWLAFSFIRSGVYRRTWRDSYPMAITIMATTLPVVLSVLGILLAVASTALLWPGTGWVAKTIGLMMLALIGILAWLGRFYLIRYKPDWTGRVGLFAWALGEGKVARIQSRMDEMAAHVVETLKREKPDEAVIIGHSIGTAIAISVASRALKLDPTLGEEGSPLALVTLGQVHSLVSLMPQANWFRDELVEFAKFPAFTWLDFTSPADGACYVMVNPLEFMNAPRPTNVPRLLNVQFYKTLTPERLKLGQDNRLLMHFFYVQAPDHPQIDSDLYDFIMLIAGPMKAGTRFGERETALRPFYRKEAA